MRMITKMKILRESSELAQGVFWIIDLDELNKNKNYKLQFQLEHQRKIKHFEL